MQYCKKCVQADTRPGIQFDKEGVCYPCRYFERLPDTDWSERRRKIEEIAEWARQHTSCEYDCIISVSGGKDSHRLALYARDELNLVPLLVSTVAPPQMQTKIGTENLANLTSLGFDIITISPAPQVWKKVMKKSFVEYGNYAKSTELVLYASAPRVAIAYGIPIVFLGENNALVYGETITVSEDGGDASNMINYNTLGGGIIDWMLGDGVTKKDVISYCYPTAEAIKRAKLRIVYLGYYIKDFDNFTNGRLAIKNGLRYRDVPLTDTGCLHQFDAVDDDYVHVNQMLKYLKLGFGKASDEVCEAIRLGLMTREQGIELVKQLDGKCADRYIQMFCDFLEISLDDFWEMAETYRNSDIWEAGRKGQWKLKTELT